MVSGIVRPPAIELANRDLIESHLHAVWLAESTQELQADIPHVLDLRDPALPVQKDSRERSLYEEFETAKRTAEASSVFARVDVEDGGRFPLTGRGDVNTYALFAELFSAIVNARGRAGVIVPTGIVTDATTAPFFASLVTKGRLAAVFSFENEEMIFPGIHHAMKFCLLVLKPSTDKGSSDFVFFARQVAALSDLERRFTLSSDDIALINPNTKTAPVFRSLADAELTAKIYERVPVLIDETKGGAGNPWGVSFMTMFHMSSDSGLFRTAAQLVDGGFVREGSDWVSGSLGSSHSAAQPPERFVPLYEAKMISFYDHRAASYASRGDERGFRVLPDTNEKEHANPNFEIEPFYWVMEDKVAAALADHADPRWLIGFKNVTSPTNERTMISAAIPRAGVGHSMPLIMVDEAERKRAGLLLANISSLPFDFIARQKVGGVNFTYFFLKQIPVLPPSHYTRAHIDFVISRVLELTYTSHAIAPFARDLGYDGPPFTWDEDRRAQLRAELDAWYASAYLPKAMLLQRLSNLTGRPAKRSLPCPAFRTRQAKRYMRSHCVVELLQVAPRVFRRSHARCENRSSYSRKRRARFHTSCTVGLPKISSGCFVLVRPRVATDPS
ncbi:hypothetical protein [Bradyrhizobium japonicum]|jgi:hypothetical protein|uniref:hypothetical protein n=1 Tax=Bradyrhizobium japonicum TaxID=375 RepID=UPI00209E6E83|nr:hypothetical protein [Bradyrhizobium japonicum]MCP1766320.1 hypothetical protein [Bradyrhizobium japonicum]MCP1788458.1 hypothetical protein [Bradyrhizobium japonicum]MCP1810333.1 hypothetical protein [Bradyrhizobium japonicum]MCP1819267.1 hypothetical protein [Bradyrhizobium japonicum]MCP1869223.1 hypothetical protein [Bradyrhizobium japonicum]